VDSPYPEEQLALKRIAQSFVEFEGKRFANRVHLANVGAGLEPPNSFEVIQMITLEHMLDNFSLKDASGTQR